MVAAGWLWGFVVTLCSFIEERFRYVCVLRETVINVGSYCIFKFFLFNKKVYA